MDITKILSELVLIADSLEKRGMQGVGSDIDAAIFIMSQESALPKNKSLASVVEEHRLSLQDHPEEYIESVAVESAKSIKELLELVVQLDSATMAAVLKSTAQSIKSVLNPESALAPEVVKASSELLVEAEKKLLEHDEFRGVGYRIEMIRGKIENV